MKVEPKSRRRGALPGWTAVWLLLLAGAAGAGGELRLSHLPAEAEAVKLARGAILFTAEARPGGPGDWNVAARRLPDGPPASTARFDWPNGSPVPFVLSYDGRRTVSLTLLQGDLRATASFQSDELAGSGELFLSAVAAGADTGARLAGLRLGEVPVKDAPAAGPQGQDVLRIQGADLSHGFTLTGAINLSWAGERPPEGNDLHVLLWGAKSGAPSGSKPSARVAITAPAPDSILSNGTPTLTAVFPGGPALLRVDGADRTAQAEINGSGLTFTPPARLPEGKHTAEVTVRDRDGREERASVSFTTDTVPPSIAFASPPRIVTGNPAPIIRLTYSDLTSGLDARTLKVTLDGESIDSICVANPASGVCIPRSPIAEGSHLLTATIRDRAGNTGTASFAFTLSLNEDSE